MTTCVCPGSFDPLTLGHLDVIERSAKLFERVVVAVLHNPDKSGTFTASERVELIEQSVEHLPNVDVAAYANTLLVDVCAELDAPIVIKGLRGETDFSYELPMATMNRSLSGLETLFLPGNPGMDHLSSSLIKQVASLGGDISGMVPRAVHGPLLARLGVEPAPDARLK